jgi:tRNA(fMet)-specific endonuclease VapC
VTPPQYLLDTDWAIHWAGGHPEITRQLTELGPGDLGLSIISLAELYDGVYSSRDLRESQSVLERFLHGVTLIALDPEICQLFGRERSRLRATGRIVANFRSAHRRHRPPA